MALRMVALGRAKDGRWFARKGIPADVRDAYQRLYGVRREAHLKLPGDTARRAAKAQLGGWEAEIETRIAALRAQRNGEGSRSRNLMQLLSQAEGTCGSSGNTRRTLDRRSTGGTLANICLGMSFIPPHRRATSKTRRPIPIGRG